MIKKITATNWKSFEKLEYKFQSLNILLGNNSSGKSNFLDLLEFISKVARGASNEELNKIRGGMEYFKKIDALEFEIKVDLDDDLYFKIVILNEEINYSFLSKEEVIFNNKANLSSVEIQLENLLNGIESITNFIGKSNDLTGKEREVKEIKNLFQSYSKEIEKYKIDLINTNVIDPMPSLIRGTTKHENKELVKDCSNLISFMAGMDKKEKQNIENKLVHYLKKLTFSDIQSVNFKFLGENKEFSQLYIEENGIKLHSDIVSDGMLRFIAIIVALMTQKSGGILAIEEIDNGIAPYQLKMLMNIIDEISFEKRFDVVFTTHNHLLMNYLGEEYMNFVFYVSKKNGKSSIKRIKDYKSYGKISSYGKLGDLVDNEKIINLLNTQGDTDEA